ncbi:MarR family transcriptional regulator [Halosimplex halophilum]|uniref:MarR family transcriptional regulator n=1 Tax=Halosimplex halophilum TaxID=2559572 RepID=UPI00107FC005|nr:helix-turn-helix domain-containing protein [Halosimplex halophilum]
MSRSDRGPGQPRAMIHRRILDVAESDPDASMAAIAEEVSGASPGLVERVLDEYGDPGRDSEPETEKSMNAANPSPPETEPGTDADSSNDDTGESPADADNSPTDSEGSTVDADDSPTEPEESPPELAGSTADASHDAGDDPPAAADLSERQRRTLRALYERPGASQGDLAEELDVTRATVSRRLNAIPGFEWGERRAFAEAVFGDGAGGESDDGAADATTRETTPGDAVNTDEGSATSGTDAGERESGTGPGPGDPGAGDPGADDALEGELADLEARVEAVESRVSATGDADGEGAAAALPPELAHKVVHACMESDRVTEDEELEILRAFME